MYMDVRIQGRAGGAFGPRVVRFTARFDDPSIVVSIAIMIYIVDIYQTGSRR
jgi:hypothetical protein